MGIQKSYLGNLVQDLPNRTDQRMSATLSLDPINLTTEMRGLTNLSSDTWCACHRLKASHRSWVWPAQLLSDCPPASPSGLGPAVPGLDLVLPFGLYRWLHLCSQSDSQGLILQQ